MYSYDSIAPISIFGFAVTEVAVNESIGTLAVCAEMLSQGPLLFPALLSIVDEEGSATGRLIFLCAYTASQINTLIVLFLLY